MIKPNPLDADRLFDIRCQGKRGEYLRPEDLKFCEKMAKEFPEFYKSLDKKVFEATKPFGAV